MRKKLQSTLLLAVLTITIFSCKKSDEKPSNHFTYDSKSYAIKSGITDLDTESTPSTADNSPVYFHDLYLMTSGLTTSGGDVTGKGSVVSLTLSSATSTIDAGTYIFNGDEDVEVAGKMKGLVLINYNSSDNSGNRYEFTAGTAIVAKTGDVYTVDVTATANNSQVVAHFSGTVSPLN